VRCEVNHKTPPESKGDPTAEEEADPAMSEPEAPRNLVERVPLAPHTTFRAGGEARWFLAADDVDHLARALRWAKSKTIPVFLLGGGSNLLVADEGFPGLVLLLGKGFRNVAFDPETGSLTAGGGAPMPRLGRVAADHGYADFLFLCGIPGTVGGGVRMNAGTGDGEIGDILQNAETMEPDGTIKRWSGKELTFGYRSSILKERQGSLLISATFVPHNHPIDPARTQRLLAERIDARRSREPKNRRNFGSAFKTPPGGPPAGKLIEDAGLKGASEGGAMVALEHANWIVNTGDATGEDARRLLRRIQDEVKRHSGIELEREVILVPEDVT